jgi:hypothetical protein
MSHFVYGSQTHNLEMVVCSDSSVEMAGKEKPNQTVRQKNQHLQTSCAASVKKFVSLVLRHQRY